MFRTDAPLPETIVLEPRLQLESHKPYVQAILSADQCEAAGILKQALYDGVPYADAAVGIVQPAMYKIGRLWQANRITVVQEHLATAVSQNAWAQAFVHARFAEPNNRTALFACVEGNHHALGLRIVSDAFEVAGWSVDYLGTDKSTKLSRTRYNAERRPQPPDTTE